MKQFRLLFFFLMLILCPALLFSQQRTVTGKVTDVKDNSPLVDATVSVVGKSVSTKTTPDGSFTISVPSGSTQLRISYVGFADQTVDITSGNLTVSMSASSQNLNEVVVIGYGSVRKRDLTGSVSSVGAKQFNTGQINSPEQLLQGKVAGLQITNSSGQPGGLTIVKIRGNNSIRTGNSPLYVVDGIPLDGRSARPGFSTGSVGTSPPSDPLTFINPNEIAQVDVLKDASASAIYGSRGANGVVLITTKKGSAGPARVDVNASVGIGNVMRRIDVLDASGYRNAIAQFKAPNTDSGTSVNPFDAILRSTAVTQNYSVAIGGGTDNGKYRASFFMGNQDGIILKSNLKKYVGNFNGQYKFFDKRLSVDFSATLANVREHVTPISQDAGSNGNLISLALIWNPTLGLSRNGQFFQENKSGQVNPLALSAAYNDVTDVTTALGNVNVAYKFTDWLEYRMLYGMNYSNGNRKAELQGWIQATGGNAPGNGEAGVGNNVLSSQIITHTLNFNKDISKDLSVNALAGYEYWKTNYSGSNSYVYGFNYNLSQSNLVDVHYYDNMGGGKQSNLNFGSFKEPTVEIQSYFARAVLNYQNKYVFTGTIRSDGSSKFGSNNKYAYFPSAAFAWNISNEVGLGFPTYSGVDE